MSAAGSGIVANGTTVSESGCTITTTTPNNYGIRASNGADVTLTDGSIDTTGNSSFGVGAIGPNDTTVTVNNTPIQTSGTGSDAVNAQSSTITLHNNVIQTTGQSSIGINTLSSGSVFLDNGSITTNGDNSHGLATQTGAQIVVDNTDINVLGINSVGAIASTGGGSITIQNGSSITTQQNFVYGIRATAADANVILDNSTIVTNGDGSGGVRANGGGTVTVRNGSSITTNGGIASGLGAYGVQAQTNSSVTVDNSSVQTFGPGAHGANAAGSNSNIVLQNGSTISTQGDGSYGLISQSGALITANNNAVTTSGSGSTGAYVFNGAQIDLTDNSISTQGANAYALYSNTGINTINATNTSLNSNAATLSVEQSASTFINFTNVQNNTSSNQFVLVDNLSSIELEAYSSTLVGNISVAPGGIANVRFYDGSIWTGATSNVTNLVVGSSTWNLTANSTIDNVLINLGNINFIPQGNIFKTLTTNSYIGQNGTISLNTFLGGDSSPSDMLIIDSGTAVGSTPLNVQNTTGGGALTVGNGILVIDTINGGTTAPNAFTLGNDVIAGPYEYTLFRGSTDASSSENWYLRSTLIDPLVPVEPLDPQTPNYRQEVSLYAALPSMALLYQRALIDTLHQRVGDEEQLRCQCRCQSRVMFNNVWTRVINEGGNQRGRNIFHNGPNFHYNFLAVQAGVDIYRKEHCDGSLDHVGVLGAIGRGNGKVRHFTHSTAGRNKFDAYTGGLYATHFGPSGWYLDGLLEFNWYNRIKGDSTRDIPSLKTHGTGLAVSLEGGYPIRCKCFVIEPQAQLVYQRIRLHDSHDIAAEVDFKNTNSTAGRLGIRLAKTWDCGLLASSQPRQLTVWLRTSIWNDFQGKSRTFFSSDEGPVGITSKLGGPWFQGDLGATALLTDVLSFYGTFGGNVYLNGRGQAYNVVAGLRANF